ncbi:AP-1 complex subunit gamma-1 [Thraustotheca clavata]|uniref:AP-1 complex subunit gamma n=1 Tax=Thraustotheca clavata TaxID=74557 RepID=A0A1W0AAH1_9STRA|nr:AP-1 complex subunit gamma-1 [Thraustotheca clavata]
MSIKLRDLIRNVRACKTAAEERAVIAKESALIRTAFKDQDKQYRHRNVAKLLFIHMLGYPSHFGQMECLKLIAANNFSEKRIGYLGLMLLLNDQEEVLTLVTNSLKNDLNHVNPFVVGLSLTAVGNIASPDMARDLITDIDKHLKSDNDYLRKKAALACVRVFRQVPELVEDFIDPIHALLKSRNHAVLLTGIQLIIELLIIDHEGHIGYFNSIVPTLVKELRNLLSNNYTPEYDVSGIVDPFLQVNILSCLRLLGKDNDEASEAMNDVLAQVATNTETSKNAGNAILYECVSTIMSIQSESGLKVLAINILGRFLLNRDNNIRYVALNTLSKVIADDAPAVQRHRNTIVDCLKDPDASIRQRALELIYALVNETNIQSLAREMLNYLVVSPNDQKPALCSRIADAVERYAPTQRWHIDTLITMLSITGSSLTDEHISSSLIVLIQKNPDMHVYVVHKLFWALKEDMSQLALAHVTLWCIGEYGRALGQDPPSGEETLQGKTAVDDNAIVDVLTMSMRHPVATDVTKAYGLTAAIKLTSRLHDPEALSALNQLISSYKNSLAVDLQQRAVEFNSLLEDRWDSIRGEVLAPMPVIDMARVRTRQSQSLSITAAPISTSSDFDKAPAPAAPSTSNTLLDLDDIFGGGAKPAPTLAPAAMPPTVDILADIFSAPSAQPAAPTAPAPVNDIMGMMSTPAVQPPGQHIRGYEKNGLAMDLELSKPNPNDPSITYISCMFTNASTYQLDNFVLQAAFPKYIRLIMDPPSGTVIPANMGGRLTQVAKIQNTCYGEKPIMMRIKLEFTINGTKIEDMATISNFPSSY